MEFKHLSSQPLFLASSLALDFINSEYGTGDERHDCFENDHCVQEWLETAGLVPQGTAAPPGLLAEARRLRGAARAVVHAAMESVTADLSIINRILRDGKPETRLQWEEETKRYLIIKANDKLPLTNIRIGPRSNRAMMMDGISFLLQSRGYTSTRISFTETPFR